MKLEKSTEYLVVLKNGNKPEHRCILGRGTSLESCKSLAHLLGTKLFRMAGV